MFLTEINRVCGKCILFFVRDLPSAPMGKRAGKRLNTAVGVTTESWTLMFHSVVILKNMEEYEEVRQLKDHSLDFFLDWISFVEYINVTFNFLSLFAVQFYLHYYIC